MASLSEPLVSAVIPVYNGSKYLREAIDGVLRQTYKPLELVIVDDGSTDDSPQIIASYQGRARVLRQANQGVARARNAGIRAARGEWIAFLDQDDWWLPEKVAKQVELAGANGQVGLVHTDVEHYDDVSGRYVARFNPNRSDLLVGRCYDRLLLGNAVFNCTVLVRKSVLDEVGGFNEGMPGNTVQDFDLWLRVAKRSTFAYVPDKLAVYRLHPAQGMWKVQDYLAAEVAVLERFIGDFRALTSPEMKARVVQLLDGLGVAYLDARDRRRARQSFRRALGVHWSRRVAALYAASFLPAAPLKILRGAASFLGRVLVRHPAENVPPWVREGVRRNGSGAHQPLAKSAAID